MSPEFEIAPVEARDGAEADAAKAYWGGREFRYYKAERPWSRFMAERVLAFAPASVFEFGCNAGKNLAVLRRLAPEVRLAGSDINAGAVAFARERGLDVVPGDERRLAAAPAGAYDVSFTVSVLDHLPDPAPALAALCRQSARAVLLLEPWLGVEGKVVRNADRRTGEMIDTTPFSYSWDYPALAARLVPDWRLAVEPYPIESNIGRYYNLYTLTPPTG